MHLPYIESQIVRMCKQPRTFENISKNLCGLDPIVLKETLESLEKRNKIRKRDEMWSITETKPLLLNFQNHDPQLYLKKYMGYFDFLKIPHPLDFEWRNSTESLNYLIQQVQEINSVSDKILFLGMPTLFATACIKDIPQKVTLVEKNRPILRGLETIRNNKERFQIIEADIFKVNPQFIGTYHCVIMDPPWYPPQFFQFMWLASQCVEIGGIVGISLPPINTRPHIDEERIKWFSFCQENGLCLENLYSQKLHYAMPFFEYNAFRAAGIKDILPLWRKGDLAFFRKVHSNLPARPKFEETKSDWIEKEIDTVRIRVKKEKHKNNAVFKIDHIIKGDILPTVSSRDLRRAEANVWTSGNRIFKVNNTEQFIMLLSSMKNKVQRGTKQNMVSKFVKTITGFERNGLKNYLYWLYYEMERQIT